MNVLQTLATDPLAGVADRLQRIRAVRILTATKLTKSTITNLLGAIGTRRTIGIARTVKAEIVFADLSCRAVAVFEAFFAGLARWIADRLLRVFAVGVEATANTALPALTDLVLTIGTCRTISIQRTGHTLVVLAHLSIEALRVLATVAFLANAVEAKMAGIAVIVYVTGHTPAVFADLPALAMAVTGATLAGKGLLVTNLLVAAIGVVTTTATTLPALANLPLGTVAILRTGRAFVLDANVPLLAVTVVPAIPLLASMAQSIRQAEMPQGAVPVFGAFRTLVVFADLSRLAIFLGVAAIPFLAGTAQTIREAEMALRTIAVVRTFFALVGFANLTVFAVFVRQALFALFVCRIAFGQVTVFAVSIATTTRLTGSIEADLARPTLAVFATGHALVGLANLTVFAVLVFDATFAGVRRRIADLVLFAVAISQTLFACVVGKIAHRYRFFAVLVFAATRLARTVDADLALFAIFVLFAVCAFVILANLPFAGAGPLGIIGTVAVSLMTGALDTNPTWTALFVRLTVRTLAVDASRAFGTVFILFATR